MNLYDKSSLILVPGAVKDGKAYSQRPENGDGDFTFSRGSNLAATRVDVNGLIEKGRENLLLQSNQFDTTWSYTAGSSATSGQTGYDGSSNGWLLTDSGAVGSYCVFQNYNSSGVQTFSIYAKKGSTSEIEFDFFMSPTPYLRVNLDTGSVVSSSNLISSNVENAQNGWWRISMTANLSSTFYIRFGCNGAGSVYIQDSQIELGLVATDYIETTTTTAQAGILEDMPRLDYSGGASCPSLKLEPQRTNLITQSEFFGSGSGWGSISSSPATITDNFGTSPEGLQNAAKLEFNGTNSWLAITFTAVAGNDYSASVYLKVQDGGANFDAKLTYYPTGGGTRLDKNITITSGWQRFDALFENVTTGSGSVKFVIRSNESRSCLVWGAQLEQGSYPTSYIPTYGTSQTRSKDAISEQISGLTSLEQGTFFVDFDRGLTTATARDFSTQGLYYGTLSTFGPPNQGIEISTNADGSMRAAIRTSSVGFETPYSNNTLSRFKILYKWSGTELKIFVNGSLVYDNATKWGGITAALQYIGYNADFRKSVNQLLTFPTALTDSECIALTQL